MLIADGLRSEYRKAELRLRDALLGDGIYVRGMARTEEARDLVVRELRKMRQAFEAVLETVSQHEGRAPEVKPAVPQDGRLVDAPPVTLDEQLHAAAAENVRKSPKRPAKKAAATKATVVKETTTKASPANASARKAAATKGPPAKTTKAAKRPRPRAKARHRRASG